MGKLWYMRIPAALPEEIRQWWRRPLAARGLEVSGRSDAWLAAHMMELWAASCCTGQPPHALEWGGSAEGKPFLQGYPSYSYSLSHTEGWALLGCASAALGVDIERNDRAVSPRICDRYFSEPERAFAAAHGGAAVWTRKEALGKQRGSGLTTAVLHEDTMAEGMADRIHTFQEDGAVFSVCLTEGAPPVPEMLTVEHLCEWLRAWVPR